MKASEVLRKPFSHLHNNDLHTYQRNYVKVLFTCCPSTITHFINIFIEMDIFDYILFSFSSIREYRFNKRTCFPGLCIKLHDNSHNHRSKLVFFIKLDFFSYNS